MHPSANFPQGSLNSWQIRPSPSRKSPKDNFSLQTEFRFNWIMSFRLLPFSHSCFHLLPCCVGRNYYPLFDADNGCRNFLSLVECSEISFESETSCGGDSKVSFQWKGMKFSESKEGVGGWGKKKYLSEKLFRNNYFHSPTHNQLSSGFLQVLTIETLLEAKVSIALATIFCVFKLQEFLLICS